MHSMSVDFPEPFGPRTATLSPAPTEKEMSVNRSRKPRPTVRFDTVSTEVFSPSDRARSIPRRDALVTVSSLPSRPPLSTYTFAARTTSPLVRRSTPPSHAQGGFTAATLLFRQRFRQIPCAITTCGSDGHLTTPEPYLSMIQIPEIDPLSMDQHGLTDGIRGAEVIREVGALLQLLCHMWNLRSAALELQRDRDHYLVPGDIYEEDDEVASAPTPSVRRERAICVYDNSLIGQASRIYPALVAAHRFADVALPHGCVDSAERFGHASSRDSSSLF